MRDFFFLIIPPSLMEDEGRYRLAVSDAYVSYEAADQARIEMAQKSRGFYKPSSFMIVKQVHS